MKWKKLLRYLIFGAVAILMLLVLSIALKRPSHDRDWQEGLELAAIVRQDDVISISKVRNSSYDESGTLAVAYEERTVDVKDLESIWFLVEPFEGFEAAAHTMFSFGFNDGSYLAVSVEARKEKGEDYSITRGLLREMEIVYIWGTEEDLIKRRVLWLDHPLYLYRINVNTNVIRNIFLEMVEETDRILAKPQFYHSIKNTCTSALANRVNEAYPGAISRFALGQYLPGIADKLIYDLGLLAGDGTFEEIKAKAYISDLVKACATRPDFSAAIRSNWIDPTE
jgi:hypothetical protein